MKFTIYILFGILTCTGCTTPYSLPANASSTSDLVVDGMIYASGDSTKIRLTRSASLSVYDTAQIPVETGAHLVLEAPSGGPSYMFTETGDGYYALPPQNLDQSLTYRLNITLSSGKQYLSDYVPVVPSPPIDSISWQQTPGAGVTIYANTHDPNNHTHYYWWTYVETYEYGSAYYSTLEYSGGSIHNRDTPVNICYLSLPSTNILIASSASLSKDVISMAPLEVIPNLSAKLGIEYSTLVTQTALTQGGYTYWQNMQANSEDLGSIFGPQPFQATGNIHSVSNPTETVLGYLSISTPQAARIFISNSQLQSWSVPIGGCTEVSINSLKVNIYDDLQNPGLILLSESAGIYLATYGACGDCRFGGGSLTKPTFLP